MAGGFTPVTKGITFTFVDFVFRRGTDPTAERVAVRHQDCSLGVRGGGRGVGEECRSARWGRRRGRGRERGTVRE